MAGKEFKGPDLGKVAAVVKALRDGVTRRYACIESGVTPRELEYWATLDDRIAEDVLAAEAAHITVIERKLHGAQSERVLVDLLKLKYDRADAEYMTEDERRYMARLKIENAKLDFELKKAKLSSERARNSLLNGEGGEWEQLIEDIKAEALGMKRKRIPRQYTAPKKPRNKEEAN